MANIWITNAGIEGHTEHKRLTRGFETLEAAQKFADKKTADGKTVYDVFRRRGRYAVEYEKVTRVVYDKDGFAETRIDI